MTRPDRSDGTGADSLSAAFDRLGSLLEFPVDYPIKVMGARVDGFAQAIAGLVRERHPDFDPAGISLRTSSRGTYLSISFSVRVDSREALESLYRAIAAHELVRIVL